MVLPGVKCVRVLSAKRIQKVSRSHPPTRVVRTLTIRGAKKEERMLVSHEVKKQSKVGSSRVVQGHGMMPMKAPRTRRSIHALRVVNSVPVGERAQKNQLTALEEKSISAEAQNQYGMYYEKFQDFCRGSMIDLVGLGEKTDAVLADYMDLLYLQGRSPHEGEKTVASVEFNNIALKGKLMRSRRALKGWRKAMPAQSRLPLPRLIMFGICMELAAKGHLSMALKVITDFILYLRPGEGLDIRGRNVVAPVKSAGVQYKWTTVIIRDQEGLRPDKVGVYDNSIPIDQKEVQWVGNELLRMKRKLHSQDDKIFVFTMEDFRGKFAQAGASLGIENLHPYQLRHGGATEDLTSKRRDHPQVKARGRWMTDQSVRRYAKIGRVQALLNKLSPANLRFCQWSEKRLQAVIQGQKPARSASSQ